eukprot:IDg22483t1
MMGGACTPDVLVGIWFPDLLLSAIVTTTNDYAHARLASTPKKRQRDVTRSEICLFIAVMYYMVIVRLPSKDDYWSTEGIILSHPLLNSLPHARFKYIWRNLHLMGPSTGVETVYADDTDVEEAEPHMRCFFSSKTIDNSSARLDASLSRIVPREEPESPLSDDSDDDGDDEQTVEEVDEDAEYSETWFEKVRVLIDHVQETSMKLLLRPSLAVCIDEMMIKFEGRCAETHRMKSKPIDERYK